MRFEIYQDKKKQYRWRLIHRKKIIADSGESYLRKVSAQRAILSIQDGASVAEVIEA